MKVISLVSQKGGAGKTTSALAIGQGLIRAGHDVLYLDMDYQCSLTDMLGGSDATRPDIHGILTGSGRLSDGIINRDRGDYVAGSQMMTHLDVTIQGRDAARLRTCIQAVTGYDAILIDTPPALSMAQVMSIRASDTVIIPTQADRQHYQQLKALLYTIEQARTAGCDLTVHYIVTRYNPRIRINQAYYDAIVQMMDAAGVEQLGIVSDSSVIREAQGTDANLYVDYPKSKPAQEYAAIVDKITKVIK